MAPGSPSHPSWHPGWIGSTRTPKEAPVMAQLWPISAVGGPGLGRESQPRGVLWSLCLHEDPHTSP